MKTAESFEKDDICKHLKKIGAWFFRPYMAGFGKSGVADIIACVPITITQEMVGKKFGAFVAVEVKRDGKTLTKLQAHRIDEIHACEGYAFWGTADKVIPEIEQWRK